MRSSGSPWEFCSPSTGATRPAPSALWCSVSQSFLWRSLSGRSWVEGPGGASGQTRLSRSLYTASGSALKTAGFAQRSALPIDDRRVNPSIHWSPGLVSGMPNARPAQSGHRAWARKHFEARPALGRPIVSALLGGSDELAGPFENQLVELESLGLCDSGVKRAKLCPVARAMQGRGGPSGEPCRPRSPRLGRAPVSCPGAEASRRVGRSRR